MGKLKGWQYLEELAPNQPLGTGEDALGSRKWAQKQARIIRQTGSQARIVKRGKRWAVAYNRNLKKRR